MPWHVASQFGWELPEPQPGPQRPTIALSFPNYAERSADGCILVADTDNRRLVWADDDGALVRERSVVGRDGRAVRPGSARWRAGDVELFDLEARELLRLGPAGRVAPVEASGQDGRLPGHVVVEGDGSLVLTYPTHVEVRPPNGARPRRFGETLLQQARMARLTTRGVVVADMGLHQVLELTSDGVAWEYGVAGSPGVDDGWLTVPWWVEPLPGGSVLIADAGGHRVVEVDADGRVRWDYGRPGDPGHVDGRLWCPRSATRSGSHTVISSSFNDVVVVVDADRRITTQIGTPQVDRCLLNFPRSVVPSERGLLVTDTRNTRVIEIGRELAGPIRWEFPTASTPVAERLYWPRHAAPDGAGTIVIADGLHDRLIWIDRRSRRVVRELRGVAGGTPFVDPHHVVRIDESAHYVVTDTGNDRVVRIDADGHEVWSFGSGRRGDQRLSDPHASDVFADGTVVVADTGHHRVLRLDPTGALVAEYSGPPGEPLRGPRMVQALPDGRMLVVDTDNSRLLFLDGDFVLDEVVPPSVCGSQGLHLPRFAHALSPAEVVVSDQYNSRLVALRRT